GVLRAIHPAWFVDPGAWLLEGNKYASAHLPAVGVSVVLLLMLSLILAFITDFLFRRQAPGRIVHGNIWYTVFRKHRPDGTSPWVHIRLEDETEIWGHAGDYTPGQDLANRELLIEGPNLQYRRKGADANAKLPKWQFIAVRGESITWMKVTYVTTVNGSTIIVPARYDNKDRALNRLRRKLFGQRHPPGPADRPSVPEESKVERVFHPIAGTDVEPARDAQHVEHERPEDWGWHHEFVTGRQVGGWMTFLILGLLLTTTHYNGAGAVALISMMVVLLIGLMWDIRRRHTQWGS
ncbi:MAG: hypothetical protein QOE23_3411, partial [Pseudonocardiales bacterium]|nr:hypothetical protein [Pseudonocardiales bacterium]